MTLAPRQRSSEAPVPIDVVIEESELAAALILHCRNRRIPLPASAAKSLRRVGDQICLVATIKKSA